MPISAATTKITDYVDVNKKMADLGCRYPERMALLPINFESATSIAELLQASEAATIKKLLVAEGLPLDDIVDRHQGLAEILRGGEPVECILKYCGRVTAHSETIHLVE